MFTAAKKPNPTAIPNSTFRLEIPRYSLNNNMKNTRPHCIMRTVRLTSRISGGAYIVSALVWLAYVALPARERGDAKVAVPASQKWDLALDDARNTPRSEERRV